jgi:hypothetical protein
MLTQVYARGSEKAKQVRIAIADCDRYIAKEGARNPALRPADVAVRLEWYKEHRIKLLSMLEL